MRGEKILKILSLLEEVARDYIDLFEVLITTYSPTYAKIEKELRKRRGKRDLYFENLKWELEEKRKLSKLIYKLKQQGLVHQNEDRKLSLTKKGLRRLFLLREKFEKQSIGENNDHKQTTNELLIFIYDVPEYDKKKRDFLRRFLILNNFELLQKSVWIKRDGVSEKFIDILKEAGVLDYIQLFKITKTGTIELV